MNLSDILHPSFTKETFKNPHLLPFWASVGVAIVILFSHFGLFPVPVFITGVFALVALFCAWLWPKTVFGVFLAILPLEYVSFVSVGGTDVRWYQFLAATLGLGIIVRWVCGKEKLRGFFTSLRWWDVLPVAVVLAGIFSAIHNGGGAMKQTLVLASCVFLYGLVRYFVRKKKDIITNIPFLVGPFYVVSLYAIIQNILFLFEKASQEVMPGRPNATFSEPDWLGLYAGLGVVLASIFILHLLSIRTELTKKQQALRVLSLEMLFFGWIVLVLTVARSAWLATAGGLFIMGLCIAYTQGLQKAIRWGKYVFLAGLLAVVVSVGFHLTRFELGNRAGSIGGLQEITVACPGDRDALVPQTIEGTEDLVRYNCQHINLEEVDTFKENGFVVQKIFRKEPNVEVRKNVWNTSWETIQKNPVWGIGWGNISGKLGVDERGANLNASNLFLEFWLGSGVIGFVGIIVLLGYIFIKNGRNIFGKIVKSKNKKGGIDAESRFVFSVGVLGILAVLIIFNLFNSGQFLGLFWVVLGFMVAAVRRQ